MNHDMRRSSYMRSPINLYSIHYQADNHATCGSIARTITAFNNSAPRPTMRYTADTLTSSSVIAASNSSLLNRHRSLPQSQVHTGLTSSIYAGLQERADIKQQTRSLIDKVRDCDAVRARYQSGSAAGKGTPDS